MRLRCVVALAGSVCVGSAACQPIEFTYEGGAGPTGPLASAHGDVPEGWIGPGILLDETGEPAACPSGYVEKLLGHSEPDEVASRAACPACACTPGTVACDGELEVSLFTEGASASTRCESGGSVGKRLMKPDTCLTVDSPFSELSWSCSSVDLPAHPCPAATPTIPPVAWRRAQRLCLAAAVPKAPASGHGECIWREGETACPSGTRYQHPYVTYADIVDGRGCSPCDCSLGPFCTAFVVTSPDQTCGGGTSVPVGHRGVCGCSVVSGNQRSLKLVYEHCPSLGGQPTGAIRPTSPTTICCTT